MAAVVLGISGSPIKNSNTDRLIQAMLEETACETEFIKLSDINVRPCMGCKGCVTDNICKVEDDFPALSKNIQSADGIIMGAYTPYGQIDAFTKALLERFWSLRHVTNLLKGKACATVLTCLAPEMASSVNQALAMELVHYEHMELIGQVTIPGNLPCLSCGKGDDCPQSGISLMYGPDAVAADHGYSRVEDLPEIWNAAMGIAGRLGDRIKD
ncbi:MAG: flavodoxin family protein [Desulfobacterales bacterium]|nr:flavodoxin family protein [Desulfobacterales bacterium]